MFGVALDRIGEKLPGFMDRVNEEEDEHGDVENERSNEDEGFLKRRGR